ncbi:MAG: hypothetical protein JNL19_10045 [Burkholderiales bacterium]|nr:hypothetical protein [Burkholderiales bacterium]
MRNQLRCNRAPLTCAQLTSSLISLLMCAANASAATITVTNTADSGVGSLRAAVAAAAAGDTINFAVTGTITLTTGHIAIGKSLSITGPGPAQLTISGNNGSRIFAINDGSSASDSPVALSGMRLTAGNASAGNPAGTCPAASGTSGGAIVALESVALSHLEVDGNTSARNAGGIGWFPTLNGQTFAISDSVISNNTAVCPGAASLVNAGGLMLSLDATFPTSGTVSATITRVRIVNNTAERFGGGLATYMPGTVTITDSVISGNTALTRNGGGIVSSWFDGMPVAARTILIRSEISSNAAEYGGGALVSNDSPFAQTGGGQGAIALYESTVSGNTARTSGGGISLYGNVLAALSNTTVAANGALGAGTGSGGLRLENGAVSGAPTTNNLPNQVLIESSILAANTAPTGNVQDLNFAVTGAAVLPITVNNSLIQAYNPAITINGSANVLGSSAQLAPLASNGGPTRTHALLAGSPAIDTGSNLLNAPTDQRGAGYARVVGAGPDMGAFESGATPANTCLDIDVNGVAGESTGDGVLLARYLMGLRGTALTSGLTLSGVRNTPTLIEAYLSANNYDVVGRATPSPTALVDGLILVRLMLGVPDSALLGGITVPADAPYNTATAIRGYVNSRCAMTY